MATWAGSHHCASPSRLADEYVRNRIMSRFKAELHLRMVLSVRLQACFGATTMTVCRTCPNSRVQGFYRFFQEKVALRVAPRNY